MKVTYPPPEHETDFEYLCLRLLQLHWGRMTLERYGRKGQAQDGVDILDVGGDTPYWAAQCKLHEHGKSLPPKDIKAEVTKALGFASPIGRYAILTTGKVSTHGQKAVRRINADHKDKGIPLRLELITWDVMQEWLNRYPDVARDYYNSATGSEVASINVGVAAIQRNMITRQDIVGISIALEQIPRVYAVDSPDARLADAVSYVERHEYQIGRAQLKRLREREWDALSRAQRKKLLTNLANIALAEHNPEDAGRLLLEATEYTSGEERDAANEAMAYELLSDREGAHSHATTDRARFPHSAKLLAIWIRTAPTELSLNELEAEVPPYLANSPEVATAFAWRAVRAQDNDGAEFWTTKAIDAGQKEPFVYLHRAHAIRNRSFRLSWTLGDPPRITDPAGAEATRTAYADALKRCEEWCIPEFQAEAKIGLASIDHAIGDLEAAESQYNAANALCPDQPAVLHDHGLFLLTIHRYGPAIRHLRRVIELGDAEAKLYLAIALSERNEGDERHEAIELLLELSRDTSSKRREEALRLAVLSLIAERDFTGANRVLCTNSQDVFDEATTSLFQAVLCWQEGRRAEAERLVDQANQDMNPTASRAIRRELAFLLTRLSHHSEALPIWQNLLSLNPGHRDVGYLVECAVHTGRHDLILETCHAARLAGFDNESLWHQELSCLETYDVEEAGRLLEARITSHPDDRTARLHLAHYYLITGQTDLAENIIDDMPKVEEISPQNGFLVASILRHSGRHEEAQRYAYKLLRLRPREPDAHRALHVAALDLAFPGPAIVQPEIVTPGTAVRYAEEGDESDHWIIIEDAADPNPLMHEYAPDHSLSLRLLGKRVGDSFILAPGRMLDRTASIREIRSKFFHRAWESLIKWAIRFPDESGFELVRFPAKKTDGEPGHDYGAFLQSLDKRKETIDAVETVYKSSPCSIHLVAKGFGTSVFEAVEHLANRVGIPVICWIDAPVAWDVALTSLTSGSRIVLDATALQTLLMLGLEGLLESWLPKPIVPQALIREIAARIETIKFNERSNYVMGKAEVGYMRTQVNPEERRRDRLRYESLLQLIRNHCEIRDGRALAGIEPSRREELIQLIGRSGVEAALLAAGTGYVLWTDDWHAGRLAAHEFCTRRVWTQLALRSRVEAGVLTEAEYDAASAKLIGWSYLATRFGVNVIIASGRMADWDVRRWPFRQPLDLFADQAVPVGELLTIALATLVQIHRHIDCPITRDIVTITILERLGSRRIGDDAVKYLATQIPQCFGLNAVREIETSRTIAAWLSTRTAQLRWA